MLFELINISVIFQKLINHVLYNYLNKFVIVYLDNILIYFKNEEDYEKHVKKILRRLQEKNLYLKLKKYKFHKQQIKYLEHIIMIEELKMNLKKIKAIIKFLISECVKDIQIFQKLTKY